MGRTGRITLPKHQKSKTHTQPLNIKNPFYTTGAIKPNLQPITGVLPIGVTNVEEAEKERELAKIAESYAATKFLPEKYQRLKDLQKAAIKKKEDAAMQLIIERMIEQKFEGGIPQPFKKDVLKYLGNLKKQYDLIHVLPPEAIPPGTTDRFQELVDKGIIGTNLLTEIYKYLRSEGYSEPTGAVKAFPEKKNSPIYKIFTSAGEQFLDLSKKTWKLLKHLASTDDKKPHIPTMSELLKDKGDEISRMAQENKEANRQGQQQPDPNGPPNIESRNGGQGNVVGNGPGMSLLHDIRIEIPSDLIPERTDSSATGNAQTEFSQSDPNPALNARPIDEDGLRQRVNLGQQTVGNDPDVEEQNISRLKQMLGDIVFPTMRNFFTSHLPITGRSSPYPILSNDAYQELDGIEGLWKDRLADSVHQWANENLNNLNKTDLIRDIVSILLDQNSYPQNYRLRNFLRPYNVNLTDGLARELQQLQASMKDRLTFGRGKITHIDGGGYSDGIPVKRLSYMIEPMRKYARIEEPETQVNGQQEALEKREKMYKDWQHKLYGVDPSTEKIQNAMPKTAEPFNPFTKSHSMILNNTSPLSVKRSAFPFLAFQKK